MIVIRYLGSLPKAQRDQILRRWNILVWALVILQWIVMSIAYFVFSVVVIDLWFTLQVAKLGGWWWAEGEDEQ